jgi:hypothetical protein
MGMEPPAEWFKDEPLKIWPECWDVLLLFLKVQTQWRTGPSGVVGLDYGVVLAVADRMQASGDSIALLEDLQVMELRARELINEQARAD